MSRNELLDQLTREFPDQVDTRLYQFALDVIMTIPADDEQLCAGCNRIIKQSATGRKRKYCSDGCRQRAYRLGNKS